MVKEKTGLAKLDLRDPLLFKKYMIIQGITQLADQLDKIRGEKLNHVLYLFAIIMGALIGSFFQARNYIVSLVLINILTASIIIFVINKNRIIDNVKNIYKKMEKEAVEEIPEIRTMIEDARKKD